ncbi:MAG: AAA-like domain-containing protein, partial [Limisphaerales bacterium]
SGHPELGPLQRWMVTLERFVLERFSGRVVIFIDEIDIVRSLPFSSDEFFAAIRECYNRRSREPEFERLAFGLSGVATPTDLIRDTRMTPFNIGRRIELNDFSAQEAAPLARGLGADEENAKVLLGRVLYWTGGHPYLTQRLCRALAETIYLAPDGDTSESLVPPVLPTVRTVDELAHKLFLSRQARDRDDNLIFVRERLLRCETDVAGLMMVYRKVHSGQIVPDDDTNPLVSILRLAGITRGVNGLLQVRNRIYWQVFDLNWIQTNMPAAEVRRQRRAGRRGMAIGFAVALILLLGYLFIHPRWVEHWEARKAARTLQEMEAAYRDIQSYQDSFETTVEVGLGGVSAPITGSGSIRFEKPDQVNLVTRSSLHKPEMELRLVSNGRRFWVYAPSLDEYQEFEGGPLPTPFDLPPPLAKQLGPLRLLPLYHLLLGPPALDQFANDAQNIEYGGEGELNGEPVRIIRWEHNPVTFMVVLGFPRPPPNRGPIPMQAWINTTNHLVLQMTADLSAWAGELFGRAVELPVTSVKLTERHKFMRISTHPEISNQFTLVPPSGAR